MRIIALSLIAACLLCPGFAAVDKPGPSFGGKGVKLENEVPVESLDSGVFELRPEKAEVIYVSPGALTTLIIRTKSAIEDIQAGSEVISFDFDEETGRMDIRANATRGKTNIRLTAGGRIFNIIVNIVDDGRVVYGRTFTMVADGESADEFSAASGAPVIEPDRIDLVGMTSVIERAMIDPIYAAKQQDMRSFPINRVLLWNDCLVILKAVTFFASHDTLVFRIETRNVTQLAQYLHRRQYRLFAANTRIIASASRQLVQNAVILPGQIDVVYLVVQGQKINPRNDWRLELPPQSAAVGAMLESR